MQLSPSSTADRLGAEGKMAGRIYSFDWSKHPLGPMPSWQQSLKTIVQTMLNCRFAMWLGWSPELYFFCNDACLATVGNKESWALGSSAKKVWAEIWPDIGPRAESVLQTGQATCDESLLLILERSRHVEGPYYTFSYSPVLDDAGAIGGVLCVVTEDDERVIGERRQAGEEISEWSDFEAVLRESEQRYRALVDGLPAAVYTTDAQGVITLYNQAAAALWGREPKIGMDEWCGSIRIFRPDGTPLPLDQCPMAVALKEGRPIHGEEIVIERPDGTRRHVLANPQPVLNESGAIVGAVNMLIDITESQKAQRALHQSEERFGRFMHHLPGAAWIKDLEGRYVFANETTLKTLRTTRENLYAKTDKDFLPPSTVAQFRENDRLALLNEAGVQRVVQVERDGATHHLVVHKFPIAGPVDKPTLIGGIAIDITEHKRAEDALRLRSERIELLSEMLAQLLRASDLDRIAPDLFGKVAAHVGADTYFNFMVDEQGDTLELHSYAGIPELEVKSFERLKFGDAICGTVAEIHQAITANDIQSSDYDKAALVRRLGIQTYACNPLMVGDKLFGTLSFASHTRKSFDDDELEFLRIISQYTAIAMERLRTAKGLRESEERLAQELTAMQQLHQMTTHLLGMREIPSALEEVLDAAIRIQNADFGKVQVYNPTLQILELVAQRGFHQELLDYFRAVNRDHDSASGIAMRLKQRVIIEDVENYEEYPLNRNIAAAVGYRAAHATPLISHRGDLLGMLSIHFRQPRRPTDRELKILDLYARQAADFIEVLNIEQEVRQSGERLQQQRTELEEQLIASGRLVSLGEVTASMAHEFNNPLGIILGFVQDILSVVDSSDPNYRALQIIDEEAKRCQCIVQALMDLARPQTTELNPTRINDIITRTVSLVENRLYKEKITLETAIMPDLPRIFADHQQLEQVLVNLLLNAIDAMPSGGKLSITTKTERKDGKLSMVISISDTGVGIDKELVSKIFLPFYTAGKKRGLGLGLSICERIVKNHGGTIEVESDLGKGTTFKLYLPLHRESAPSLESSVSA